MESRLTSFYARGKQLGYTVISDGWTDVQGRPLLNIVAVNAAGSVFMTAVDTSGETKNSAYIAKQISTVVEQLGPENVVQVVTDNAPACKSAGDAIMVRYPHITWSGCAAHTCDLALEDIFKLEYFKQIYTSIKEMVQFINNHQHTQAAWRNISNRALLKPGETRFASEFIMLERAYDRKAQLQQLVVSEGWHAAIATMRVGDQAHASRHRQLILDDQHWDKVAQVIQLAEPIVKMLRVADGDAPSASKVHALAFQVQESLAKHTTLPAGIPGELARIWDERWTMMDSALHGAGYCLDPQFMGDMGVGGSNAQDRCFQGLLTMIRRLVPEQDRPAVRGQYANYKARSGSFGLPEALEDAPNMPAHLWWDMYGNSAAELKRFAMKILSQVSSSSACERNWSTYDFIHSRRRNRLLPTTAKDLVWVFTNGRLADRHDNSSNEEVFVGWDAMQESSESEGDAAQA